MDRPAREPLGSTYLSFRHCEERLRRGNPARGIARAALGRHAAKRRLAMTGIYARFARPTICVGFTKRSASTSHTKVVAM